MRIKGAVLLLSACDKLRHNENEFVQTIREKELILFPKQCWTCVDCPSRQQRAAPKVSPASFHPLPTLLASLPPIRQEANQSIISCFCPRKVNLLCHIIILLKAEVKRESSLRITISPQSMSGTLFTRHSLVLQRVRGHEHNSLYTSLYTTILGGMTQPLSPLYWVARHNPCHHYTGWYDSGRRWFHANVEFILKNWGKKLTVQGFSPSVLIQAVITVPRQTQRDALSSRLTSGVKGHSATCCSNLRKIAIRPLTDEDLSVHLVVWASSKFICMKL